MRSYWRIGLFAVATFGLGLCPTRAWANVYVSGVTIDASTFGDACGTMTVSYVLNENANGDGNLPGVKIEVLDGTGTAVRTVIIARQGRGKHAWQWDGRLDNGTLAPTSSYTIRITAADAGHNKWVQIGALDTPHSFWYPRSVAVNKNPASPYYGMTYVANNNTAAPGNTAFGRTTLNGVYALTADGADAGFSAGGGYDWTADGTNYSAPYKLNVGEDDHVYVTSYWDDITFDFAPDLSSAIQLTDHDVNNTNYGQTPDIGQWCSSATASGSQAAGNRVLYEVNPNYSAAAPNRRGVIKYDLLGDPTAAAAGYGTWFIDQYQAGAGYYGFDIARDTAGYFYVTNYRSKAGEAQGIEKYDPTGARVATFTTPKDQLLVLGIGVCEVKNRIAIAKSGNGTVQIYDAATGAFAAAVAVETSARTVHDVGFDAVGNMYTVCSASEWMRVWSPPDGPNHNSFTTASFAMNKTGDGGPTITGQPQDVRDCANASAAFTVAATGSNLTYKWQRNGLDLTDDPNVLGSDTNSLTLSNVTGSDNGTTITVRVCGDNGVVMSNIALLIVGVYILQPPASVATCHDTDATFSILATGKGSLSYLWQKDAAGNGTFADIPGAIGTSVTLSAVQPADNGTQVRCVVTDDCGPVNSPAAILTVLGNPSGVAVYFPVTAAAGANAHFYAQGVGTGTLHYQWYKTVQGVKTPVGIDASTLDYIAEKCDNWVDYSQTPAVVMPAIISCAITDDCGTTEANSQATYGICYLTVSPGGPVPENTYDACHNEVDDDCSGAADCADPTCKAVGACCNTPFADAAGSGGFGYNKGDGAVDQSDFAFFQLCFTGPDGTLTTDPALDYCKCLDVRDTNDQPNPDGHVAMTDLQVFLKCVTGPAIPWVSNPDCP